MDGCTVGVILDPLCQNLNNDYVKEGIDTHISFRRGELLCPCTVGCSFGTIIDTLILVRVFERRYDQLYEWYRIIKAPHAEMPWILLFNRFQVGGRT